jgi:GH35 family endo-1,4-beta-xylanase
MRLPLLLALFCLAPHLAAQPAGDDLYQGMSPLDALRYYGPGAGAVHGNARRVAVQGQGFSEALRLSTLALPDNATGADEGVVSVRSKGRLALAKGDAILAEYWIRCVEGSADTCAVRLAILGDGPDQPRIAGRAELGRKAWRKARALLTAADSAAPNAYTVNFTYGHQKQVVEIAGISLKRYPAGTAPSAFGIAHPYEGAEPDAAWRKAADKRIDQIRKAPVTVTVTGPDGKPAAGAQVRVRMTRHAFPWGTAISAATLLADTPDAERYRKMFLENFNAVVFENDLKWPQWERNRQLALDGVAWMRRNGITWIRGHNLVWPSWRWLPKDLPSLAGSPAALRKRAEDHIADTASANRGTLKDWDVLNEPYTNYDLMALAGDSIMIDWFKLAKQHDPFATLYINDFGILSGGGADLMHINHYQRTIRYLLDNGAPVEGIGMQGHFGSPTPPERMLEILDLYARFGKPIAITEFDFEVDDQQLQAQFTRDLLTVCFSHPSVNQFLMWGFWEGRHWKPRGAMINRTWDPKPNYRVWRELVYKQWWTDETLTAGPDGRVSLRAFMGDYTIDASAAGRSASTQLKLDGGGAQAALKLN